MAPASLTRRVVLIRARILHMGAHSGYDLVAQPVVQRLGNRCRSVHLRFRPHPPWVRRVLDGLARRVYSSPFYKRANLMAELEALAVWPWAPKIVHVLYGEDNLGLLARWRGHPGTRLVVTLHQPALWWQQQGLDVQRLLGRVDAIIVLCNSEAEALRRLLDVPVFCVPHGVDDVFFSPPARGTEAMAASSHAPRCVFVGNWLRDFRTLRGVVERLSVTHPEAVFDVVTPERSDREPEEAAALAAVLARSNVVWHRGVGDEDLRAIYQRASLLLLPLHESTANNAVLEAMACGLPVVTTRTSGMVDYVSDAEAILCERGDDQGMAAAAAHVLAEPGMALAMSSAARLRAEAMFTWDRIARATLQVYGAVDGR